MAGYVICQSRKIMTDIKFKELGVVEYMETYDAMMELIASQPSFHSKTHNLINYSTGAILNSWCVPTQSTR